MHQLTSLSYQIYVHLKLLLKKLQNYHQLLKSISCNEIYKCIIAKSECESFVNKPPNTLRAVFKSKDITTNNITYKKNIFYLNFFKENFKPGKILF